MKKFDHPIFLESILYIRSRLGMTGLNGLQQEVLERLIHASGDFEIQRLLQFSPQSCELGIAALIAGAPILTDTYMAAAAVKSMARRSLNSPVKTLIDYAPNQVSHGSTRLSEGMKFAWNEISNEFYGKRSPVVLFGSSPTALMALLDLILIEGQSPPSLIIGMPVGFIGVLESKKRLYASNLPYISLSGNRGGASLVASTVNALLRASCSKNF